MTDENNPKLTLIQKASKTSNPFDPASLRLSANGTVVAKKALLRVPVRKPGKAEFIRVNPDEEFIIDTLLLEHEKDFFLVLPHMRDAVLIDAKPYLIYTVMNRAGVLSLWPVRMQGEDDTKSNGWWDSSHEIANIAKREWVRCSANMSLQAYEATVAQISLPEPEWPDRSIAEILELAFKAQVIDSPDSQILKILQGRI